MDRFEALKQMERIINQEINALVPGIINDYLIEAPATQWFDEKVELKITARHLKWNTMLGGVSQSFPVFLFGFPHAGIDDSKNVNISPCIWEWYQTKVNLKIKEMLLKIIQMIKEKDNEQTD